MKKILPILFLLAVLGACIGKHNDKNVSDIHDETIVEMEIEIETTDNFESVAQETIMPIETEPVQKLEPIEGYDILQTIFLMFDKDTTSDEVLSTLGASGLYYSDTEIANMWYFDIAYNEPISRNYGSNIFDTDSIQLSLKKTEDGIFRVETMTYYFKGEYDGKIIMSTYSFDRGYSEYDLENAKEVMVFTEIDNSKGGAFSRNTTDGTTRNDVLNMGIEYREKATNAEG